MIISYIVADMASHFTTSPRLYYHPPHVSILLLTNTVTWLIGTEHVFRRYVRMF